MGTLTTGNIKAGAVESSDSPPANTYVSHANSTVTIESSTEYAAGGQEIETYNLTTLNPAEAFVYEKRGVGKKQGYPGFCLVSDQSDGSAVFVDRGPNRHRITRSGDTHHDSGGGVFLHNDTSIYFDGSDYLTHGIGGCILLQIRLKNFYLVAMEKHKDFFIFQYVTTIPLKDGM